MAGRVAGSVALRTKTPSHQPHRNAQGGTGTRHQRDDMQVDRTGSKHLFSWAAQAKQASARGKSHATGPRGARGGVCGAGMGACVFVWCGAGKGGSKFIADVWVGVCDGCGLGMRSSYRMRSRASRRLNGRPTLPSPRPSAPTLTCRIISAAIHGAAALGPHGKAFRHCLRRRTVVATNAVLAQTKARPYSGLRRHVRLGALGWAGHFGAEPSDLEGVVHLVPHRTSKGRSVSSAFGREARTGARGKAVVACTSGAAWWPTASAAYSTASARQAQSVGRSAGSRPSAPQLCGPTATAGSERSTSTRAA